MNQNSINLMRGVSIGVLSGMIWGIVVLVISSFTQLFAFDFSIFNNIPIFIAGGAGFGLLLGAFLEVSKDKLPFRGIVPNSVALSVSIWILFFGGGLLLHLLTPNRYHLEGHQHLQGFFLSIVLGLILGIFWKKWEDFFKPQEY